MSLFTRRQQHLPGRVPVLCVVLGSVLIPPAFGQTSSPRQTLYQRLGGYDGVASYVALVFPQLVVELICWKTGGPCAYIGRPMMPVHDGLGITEANWSTFMKIISDGMNEKKYPSDIRDEFLAIWRSFHESVVQE